MAYDEDDDASDEESDDDALIGAVDDAVALAGAGMICIRKLAGRSSDAKPRELDLGYKGAVGKSPDLTRIVALPRRPPVEPGTPRAEALIELMTSRLHRERTLADGPCTCASVGRDCITRLNYAQAWMLFEMGTEQGLVAQAAVGIGKTLTWLLAPFGLGFDRPDQTTLLLVPPKLVEQLWFDYQLAGQHFKMPSIQVHGRERHAETVPGAPLLHVLPYSLLQNKAYTTWIEKVKPDAIVSDEAHMLANPKAARTQRVLRFFAGNIDTRFACGTGSLTDDSLLDYYHLCALALRLRSPLPVDPDKAKEWADAIDPSDWQAPAGALRELCAPGEDVEDGLYRRLRETRGFITTPASILDVDLEVEERVVGAIPAEVQKALRDLRVDWMRPDGDILTDALTRARALREVSSGVYYVWSFPRGEARSLIDAWKAYRRDWRADVREKLKRPRAHLDSPYLCQLAAMRGWGEIPNECVRSSRCRGPACTGCAPVWKPDSWPLWRDIKPQVKPVPVGKRLHPFLAESAAAWTEDHRGIIWYGMVEFGKWVSELARIPLHGGGPDAGRLIRAEKGDRSICASIASHGTGRDGLQFVFADQLVGQPPSSGAAWEQLFGRLVRLKQKAKVVHADVFRHTKEYRKCIDTAFARARYAQRTLGAPQRLIAGWKVLEDYDDDDNDDETEDE